MLRKRDMYDEMRVKPSCRDCSHRHGKRCLALKPGVLADPAGLTQVITFLLGSEMFCIAREVPGTDSLLDIGDALSFDDEGWIGDEGRERRR